MCMQALELEPWKNMVWADRPHFCTHHVDSWVHVCYFPGDKTVPDYTMGKRLASKGNMMLWAMFCEWYFDTSHLLKHCYWPSTFLYGNSIPWWQWLLLARLCTLQRSFKQHIQGIDFSKYHTIPWGLLDPIPWKVRAVLTAKGDPSHNERFTLYYGWFVYSKNTLSRFLWPQVSIPSWPFD